MRNVQKKEKRESNNKFFFDGSNNKLIIHANKHNITVPKTVEILGIVFFFLFPQKCGNNQRETIIRTMRSIKLEYQKVF